MVPNASDLARRRAVFVAGVRLLALLAFWVGFTPLAVWLGVGLAEQSFFQSYNLPPFIFGLVVIAAAVGLWLLARPLAALALPHKNGAGCPGCGYDVRGATTPRCPECGLILTDEFRADDVAPGPSQHPAARLAITQGLMAGTARLIAALAFLPLVCAAGLSVVALISELNNRYSGSEDYAVFVVLILTFASMLALCVVPWILPGWVGRRLAPASRKPLAAPPPETP